MAPTVKLILDDAGCSYSSGQEITGRVQIGTAECVPKAELTISLVWKGVGEGPNGSVSVVQDWETKILTTGDCEPVASVHPFKFQAPVRGRTYRGKIIDIGWYLRAEARVAGKTINYDETVIQLTPPGHREDQTRPHPEPVILRESYRGMTGCLLISLAFLIGGIAIVWWFDAGILGVIPGGFGMFGTLLGIRGLLVKRKLSDVVVWIASKEVRAGNELPVSLKFQTRKPVEIQRISVLLRCWEQVGSTELRSRGTGRFKKHTLFEQEWVLPAPQGQVQPGFPLTFAEKVKVPPDVPGSLELGIMRIMWQLEFRIAMARNPDWWDEQRITVF